jgi:hypothetical protein
MPKELIFSDKKRQEARQKMLAGVNELARIEQLTKGPRGRNIVLEKSYDAPMVEKHGNPAPPYFNKKNLGVKQGDYAKIVSYQLLLVQTQQTRSSVQMIAQNGSADKLSTEKQPDLKSPSHISGTIFHTQEPVTNKMSEEDIRKQLG